MSPGEMPKLGKAGSLQSRQAIVHSLVHTESWAIDLSWVLVRSFLFAYDALFGLRIEICAPKWNTINRVRDWISFNITLLLAIG